MKLIMKGFALSKPNLENNRAFVKPMMEGFVPSKPMSLRLKNNQKGKAFNEKNRGII